MKTLLGGLIALVILAWGLQIIVAPMSGNPLWVMREEVLLLSGLLSFAMLSLACLLAARPLWLERPLGGLDRMYRTHKWAGILATAFAVLHWIDKEIVGDALKAGIGRAGKVAREHLPGLLEPMRHVAKDVGEWGFYALLALVAVALARRLPYRPWRFTHQVMPLLYLALAFHALLWAPKGWWLQPVGLLLALLAVAGTYGSVLALAGRIGRQRQASGRISALEHTAPDIISVRCQLDGRWRGHRPGQFVFATFHAEEGAHPFTLASADRGDGCIELQIKALGDYTRALAQRLQVGQSVRIEGPYGRFTLPRARGRTRQIWIAGGIGVTPFLSWLESLQSRPERAPAADLHYCTRDRETDPFVTRLQALCATLPGIRLQVHGERQGERIDAGKILEAEPARPAQRTLTDIWYCGPQGLADKLKAELRPLLPGRLRFHQEAFQMR